MSDSFGVPGFEPTESSPSAKAAPRGMRAPDASPIDRLLDEPQRFEFHQAVRLLQGWSRQQPADEQPAIRFRNSLSLAFPASEIMAIDTTVHKRTVDDGAVAADEPPAVRQPGTHVDVERIELTPTFMGLLGATGALPLAYSEQFAQRESVSKDGAARAFLDIFQHRAVSLFHEAWRKHRLPLQFEADRRERYLPLVLSLAGLGEPALRRRLHGDEGGVADDALAFYAGLLQRRAVSASHLQRVLADYFGVAVRVTQFVGRWFTLDDDCQVTLGRSQARLGHDTPLGPRVWQRDLRARVSIGPMTRAQHKRFLPGGAAALALRELLTLVSGVSLEYEVCLRLRASEVLPTTLTGAPQDWGVGPRLGWDTFLLTQPVVDDREEPAYDIHAMAA